MEGILFLSVGHKSRFDLGFFLKWSRFHGQSRWGPVGVASIDHAYHWYSRRWDHWFGPVWNWCHFRLGVPIRMARCAGDTRVAINLSCWMLQGDGIRVWCWWWCSQNDMLWCSVMLWFQAQFGLLQVVDRWERRWHVWGWEWVVDGEEGVRTWRIGMFFEDDKNVPINFCQFPECKM